MMESLPETSVQRLFLKPASAQSARAAAMQTCGAPAHATIGVWVTCADCRLQQAPPGTTG